MPDCPTHSDSRAYATKLLDPASVAFQWAIYDRPLLRQHSPGDYGSGVLDAAGGCWPVLCLM
jgi:hypothetical protein